VARPSSVDPLERFSPATRDWFREAFAEPTRAQQLGWPAIARGRHALLHAPTGSGKTLAAFLWCLDRLFVEPPANEQQHRTRVLYVSPLKALAYDVERNLRAPLAGIRRTAEREGLALPDVRVASRTGDTPADARRQLVRDPPDILVTTPESLYLLLTSQAREILRGVEHVIVDEVHALAGTKRGAHLALSLERLSALAVTDPQRIGLSATQRPLSAIAAFLGGAGREVQIVDAGARKELDLEVIVPVEDMSRMGEPLDPDDQPGGSAAAPDGRHSIWPSMHPRLLELIRAHRSTLIFVNSRRLAERLAQRLNELAGEELVRAHHGSVAREQRLQIEEALKAGRLPALVATSSLELGIDMGAIDLVVQVESPPSVAAGLQRIGRAGHQVGEPSTGKIFPKFRGDLLESAVIVERMHAGAIEETHLPRNPLDVLAQQLVAMTALDKMTVDGLHALVIRAENFRDLSRGQLEGVLDMLAGRYPSDEFADLKPRLVWDRASDEVSARNDARVVAITSGGTIPDRGLYGVFLPDDGRGKGGRRVGELDEEMVYESREGETFLLGASTWRIEEIKPDRVIVTPAPGEPGKMPFWHGDAIGRPAELGRAIGAFVRELDGTDDAVARLQRDSDLDPLAAANLVQYLAEQREATGALPTDRTIVIERFRDELGDWRVCLLSPFGGRVHAPWAMAIEARLRERGQEAQTLWSDDGIVVRLPEADAARIEDEILIDPEEIESLLTDALGGSALFAARFRENAARALLLPRRRPGQRTPLWMQRQKSADLLAVASRYGSFPIILETYREVLRDVFDMPALRAVLAAIRSRAIRIVSIETASASPFAASLLFDYVGNFMYEGDAPLAERRAQALALDRERLAELLGADELRELLDPEAVAELELELQALSGPRRARTVDGVHDLLRRLGDLRSDEVAARAELDAVAALAELARDRRAVVARIGGEERWIAIEDVARYRDALGVSPPPGVAETWLAPADAPLDSLLLRWARSHAPFTAVAPAARWGMGHAVLEERLRALVAAGSLLEGEFRPGGDEREFSDADVLRALRRRSLARLRREVEPVPPAALVRFVAAWQGIGSRASGMDRLLEVVAQLEGYPIPVSILERDVLRARVREYTPRLLDELGAAGEVVWIGRGAVGRDDGRVALYRRERAELLASAGAFEGVERPTGVLHDRIRDHLQQRGASFFRELRSAVPDARTDDELLDALWDLAWAGEVTNDTFAALRALSLPRSRSRSGGRRPSPRLAALGPPRGAGRWSLVAGLVGEARGATERSHAIALSLLDRHGVVTRETALSEGIAGGFASGYPVLKAMEEAGRVRRGYFVEGLGGAQFALPGAVDRLRAERESADEALSTVVLAAADPAQPYGAALPWPRRNDEERLPLQRVAGAYVVLVGGLPALYVERAARGLLTLPACDDPEVSAAALAALPSLLAPAGPMRELRLERVDRLPVAESPLAEGLRGIGFRPTYRSWLLDPASCASWPRT
jgi:ATP-dependent Lhr-like helicase